MTFDGFDAALPIESGRTVPPVMAEQLPEYGPTLDAALAQAGLAERSTKAGREALFERHDAIGPDLWLSPGFHTGRRAVDDVEALMPLRKLDDAEMALIAGGSNSDMNGDGDMYPGGPNWPIVIGPPPYWDWNFPGGDDGGGGGGWGGGGGQSGGPDGIDLTGRDCPTDQAAARDALQRLYDGSPTARL